MHLDIVKAGVLNEIKIEIEDISLRMDLVATLLDESRSGYLLGNNTNGTFAAGLASQIRSCSAKIVQLVDSALDKTKEENPNYLVWRAEAILEMIGTGIRPGDISDFDWVFSQLEKTINALDGRWPEGVEAFKNLSIAQKQQ